MGIDKPKMPRSGSMAETAVTLLLAAYCGTRALHGGTFLRPLILAVVLACLSVLSAQFRPAGDPRHPRTLTIPTTLAPAEAGSAFEGPGRPRVHD
jgi:hypothetical protein